MTNRLTCKRTYPRADGRTFLRIISCPRTRGKKCNRHHYYHDIPYHCFSPFLSLVNVVQIGDCFGVASQ
jgi:hypothetical protein